MEWQERERCQQQADVEGRLQPNASEQPKPVRVGVTRQEAGLEEQEASGPNGWPAAKPGQDITTNHGLQLE